MLGLEGNGFILSIGLTLLIAGVIVYYVNNKFKETAQQIQTVLQIVQQVNSTQTGHHPMPMHMPSHANTAHVPSQMNDTPPSHEINGVTIKQEDLISVSDDDDDDDSDVSSTTENALFDEGSIVDNKNIMVNLDSNHTQEQDNNANADDDDDDDDDDDNDDDDDDDDNNKKDNDDDVEVKSIDLNNASGGELDSMLLNIIDIHTNNVSTSKLNDMKVTDLRELIKERGIKVSNLGKLKKNECIELLS